MSLPDNNTIQLLRHITKSLVIMSLVVMKVMPHVTMRLASKVMATTM